jgi:hypothetical protein
VTDTSGPHSEQIAAAITSGGNLHVTLHGVSTELNEAGDLLTLTITIDRGDFGRSGALPLVPATNLLRDLQAAAVDIEPAIEFIIPLPTE